MEEDENVVDERETLTWWTLLQKKNIERGEKATLARQDLS